MNNIFRKEKPKQCHTCEKHTKNNKCSVLTERIGLTKNCWAWTDDPSWFVKVKSEVEMYALMRADYRRNRGDNNEK